MNAQLNYMMVRHRSAELRRAGERARLATEATARRRRSRDENTITRLRTGPGPRRAALEVGRAIGGAR
jgi:hypothetical protein